MQRNATGYVRTQRRRNVPVEKNGDSISSSYTCHLLAWSRLQDSSNGKTKKAGTNLNAWGLRRDILILQASVVQKLDSAMHRINHYPVDNAIGFPITYPLDSDLSGG